MKPAGPGTAREALASWLGLFTATGTLLCCALPVLLVSLGFGAAVAGLSAQLPWLVTMSRHAEWVFAGSLLVLVVAGWAVFRPDRRCPADPAAAARCMQLNRWNRRVWWSGAGIWLTGAFFAWGLTPLLRYFD